MSPDDDRLKGNVGVPCVETNQIQKVIDETNHQTDRQQRQQSDSLSRQRIAPMVLSLPDIPVNRGQQNRACRTHQQELSSSFRQNHPI